MMLLNQKQVKTGKVGRDTRGERERGGLETYEKVDCIQNLYSIPTFKP